MADKHTTSLPGKWSFSRGNSRIIVRKRRFERETHVLMKAFIWALYLDDYPDLEIERGVNQRYKPDVVSTDERGRPVFWGEAGHVSRRKLKWVLGRHPDTHVVFTKWGVNIHSFSRIMETDSKKLKRRGNLDIISFPAESGWRHVDKDGTISITFADISWKRIA